MNALARVHAALVARGCMPPNHKSGGLYRCPAHPDKSPSLSVRAAPDGTVLLHDFGGCDTRAVLDRLGLSWVDLQERERLWRDPAPNGSALRAPAPRSQPAETSAEAQPVAAAVLVEQSELFDPDRPRAAWERAKAATDAVLKQDGRSRAKDDREALAYLDKRKLREALDANGDGEPLAALLPPGDDLLPPHFRLLVPLYSSAGGELVAAQARYIGDPPSGTPKVRTPKGCPIAGALFANAPGRRLLRGESDAPEVAILTEGLADFLALGLACPTLAVFAVPGTGNVESALRPDDRPARWLARATLTIALDSDPAGVKAATEAERLAVEGGAVVRRARWTGKDGPVKDAAELNEHEGAGAMLAALNAAPYLPHGAGRFLAAAVSLDSFLAREIERPRALVGDGLLNAGDLAVLYGKPGLGKSWLALMLAVAIAGAREWLGLNTAQGRVGIVTAELHDAFLQERLRLIVAELLGKNAAGALRNVLIATPAMLGGSVDLLRDAGGLMRWADSEGLDMIEFDPLSRMHHVDENASADFAPVLAVADEMALATGCASVLVHHERKRPGGGRDDDDLDALRGTSRLISDPKLLLRLKRHPSGLLTLVTAKANTARTPEPLWLRQRDDGLITVAERPESNADENDETGRAAFIEAGAAGLSAEELCERTGLKRSTAAEVRKRLKAVAMKPDERTDGKKWPPRYRLPDFEP